MPHRAQKRSNKKSKKTPSSGGTIGNSAENASTNIPSTGTRVESIDASTCDHCGIRMTKEWNFLFQYTIEATTSSKAKNRLLLCDGCAQVHQAKKELNAKCANCKCCTCGFCFILLSKKKELFKQHSRQFLKSYYIIFLICIFFISNFLLLKL